MQKQAILHLQRDRRRDEFPPLLPLDELADLTVDDAFEDDADDADLYVEGTPLAAPPPKTLPLILPIGMEQQQPARQSRPKPGLWDTERMTTEAVLEEEQGKISVLFPLAGVKGIADCSLSFAENEPSLVTLEIGGWLPFSSVFEQGRAHPGTEPSPGGPLQCLIRTGELRNELTANGGELYVFYTRIGFFFPCTCRLRIRVETL